MPAGREDANVRMLGTGRPFYCELVNPRSVNFSQHDYLKMQEEINNLPTKESVQVRDLTLIDGYAPDETVGEDITLKTFYFKKDLIPRLSRKASSLNGKLIGNVSKIEE